MRIPTAWLREYVPVPEDAAGLAAFCDMLTMAGLEVEEILDTPAGPTLYTKITPNRGDWASVYGTAREAAAAGKLPLAPYPGYPERAPEQTAPSLSAAGASVIIEAPDACPRYAAKLIRNVTIGPSPQWMQDRLTAANMRPVNNVVDVTNYVMLETGQPLHAFDLDTLPGGAIVVRLAREGETLTTLDGVERTLAPDMLCICDHEKPIAVAGVMGGGPTEVTETTKNILLESAHFDALSIRRTSKRLGLGTEASFRFERNVDPLLVSVAAARAAALLAEVAGGTVEPTTLDVVAKKFTPRRILARVDRVRRLLGCDVDREESIAGLERLGIRVDRIATNLDCVLPTWRPDLTIEDDIAEEIGRVALGYENLPETLPPPRAEGGKDSPRGLFIRTVREALVRAGLQDVHSHSLTAPSPLASEEEIAHRVLIRAPLSPELSSLRTALLPNLLGIVRRAHESGIRDAAVFEVGPVYRKRDGGGYEEPLHVSGAITGSAMPQAWSLKPEAFPADFYFAKGVVEDLLSALGVGPATFAAATAPITHPGRTAEVLVGGERIGLLGEVSEAVVESHDLPRRVYVFDLDGDRLLTLSQSAGQTLGRYTPLPKYPAVTRDLAPVFAAEVPYAEIARVATEAAGPLLESLRLTDVYEGANVGAGKRSLTLRFTFRSRTGTLRDAEVEAALGEVRTALVERTGADLRTG